MFALFSAALRAVLPSTSTINNERNEDKETWNSSLAAQLQNIIIETTQSIRGHINRMHSFLLFLMWMLSYFPSISVIGRFRTWISQGHQVPLDQWYSKLGLQGCGVCKKQQQKRVQIIVLENNIETFLRKIIKKMKLYWVKLFIGFFSFW